VSVKPKETEDLKYRNPVNLARINLNEAKVEEIQSQSRVQYLMRREKEMMRKVLQARELATKIENNVKNKRGVRSLEHLVETLDNKNLASRRQSYLTVNEEDAKRKKEGLAYDL